MARTTAPDTRERVLDTVTPLFYENGVQAVGMQQIIDDAGCGKNLLYREFPSKADLVAAYLARTRQTMDQQTAEAIQGTGEDAATQLVSLIQAVADSVRVPHYRGCPFRNYLVEISDHTDAAGRIATAYLRDSRAQIDALVGRLEVAHPDVLTERIWLIVEGLHTAAAHPGGTRAGEIAVSLVADLIDSAASSAPGC